MKLLTYPFVCATLLAVLPAMQAEDAPGAPAPKPPEARKEIRIRRAEPRPREMERATFLGVEAGPVSPTLVSQLALPNGAGLVVLHVVPGSPAAGALQVHDILLRLDDQILIDQHQLAVLVRSHKEGDEVTLTYVRGGKQATARLKLATHEVPKLSDVLRPIGPMDFGRAHVEALSRPEQREEVDRVLSMMHPRSPAPVRVQIERGEPGIRAMSVNTGKSNLVYSDDKGSLELTIDGDDKTLVAKDAKGAQVFSGPVGTPEQRKALAPELRERLEKLESMQDVTFRTDDSFEGSNLRVLAPAGQPIRFRTIRSESTNGTRSAVY